MAPLRSGRAAPGSEGPVATITSSSTTTTTIGGMYEPQYYWSSSAGDSDHGFESSHSGDGSGSEGAGMVRCCLPIGECLKPKGAGGNSPFSELGAMINLEDLRECVRVQCSNESCTAGQYMHRECFDRWEDEALACLKSTGRARSWSDKQRQQYLWTKKGYDLVQKVCGCKCGRGSLKKDLDWNAPTTATMFGRALVGTGGGGGGGGVGGDVQIGTGGGAMLGPIGDDETMKKQKKKKNRHNQKLAISMSASSSANSSATSSPNSQHQQQQHQHQQHQQHQLQQLHQQQLAQQQHLLLQQQDHQQQQQQQQADDLLSILSKIRVSAALNTTAATPGRRVDLTNLNVLPMMGMQRQQQHHLHNNGGGASIMSPGMLTNAVVASARMRANSLSSSISNGSCTPPASSIGGGSEQSVSPIHNQPPSPASIAKLPLTPKSKVELYSERVRATSGANGIFSRRLDFSSFNVLPRQRINSYSIKIEDEGNHGNDETRLFILSSLAAQHKSRVACVLCEEPMLVFDRYPLVDGTFFLSPKQHNKGCIEVKYENRVQYLTSVCMACLEGVEPNRIVRCRFCVNKWDGSSLVLGTMYSYDIFAAMPCCTERLKCNNCFKLMLSPHQRLNFYSDYSHSVSCPYCSAQDNHFVKPLSYCYTKQPMQYFQQWP
ncbi:headcase protein [Anopheles merus]|uniref:headcase protein n=1 Tax=Anopheles merus TaxID=30066 RepID=UPI001BE48622|nr:headcase protein [Anopheles merus]